MNAHDPPAPHASALTSCAPGRVECNGLDSSPHGLVVRFAAGAPTAADIDLVCRAMQARLRSEGEITIDRALRLPSTEGKEVRARRDACLRLAALELGAPTAYLASKALEVEWRRFRTSEFWSEHRGPAQPPEHATALQKALFEATVLSKGRTMSARQIQRAITDTFSRDLSA
jgi:hypothetical protein